MNKITIFSLFLAAGLIWAARLNRPPAVEAIGFLQIVGRIVNVTPCCNGLMLTLAGPRPGNYMYYFQTSILLPYFNIFTPGPSVLGRGLPGGVCQPMATACITSIPTVGSFVSVGTSGL